MPRFGIQSDTDERTNRFFIRDALSLAVRELRRDDTIEEAPRLDHDTKGIPGTPDIFQTILTKIAQAGIFVADLTFVAATPSGERSPNPNVLLELGYALARLTDRRVITVLNEAHGGPELLPFDLARHRWPIRYDLTPGEKPPPTAGHDLAAQLVQAIRDILASGPVVSTDLALRAHVRSIVLDPGHEVARLDAWSAEQTLLGDPTGRGIFDLLKNLPSPESACQDATEQAAVTELLPAYREFRAAASALDEFSIRFAGDQLSGNTYVPYWRIIAGYCVCIAGGWREEEALLVSQTQGVTHDGEQCRRISGLIIENAKFKVLLARTQEARNGVVAKVATIRETMSR